MNESKRDRRDPIEIKRRIRLILSRHWDPLSVSGVVDHEYDSYIGGIYRLLSRHASDDRMARHLQGIEVGALGINGTPFERLLRVAIELRQLQIPGGEREESTAGTADAATER